MDSTTITSLVDQISGLSETEAFELLAAQFPGKVVFSTSFGREDQVITHLLASAALPISVFTLDTGRLFPETYAVWSRTLEKYALTINAYYPNEKELQQFISAEGPNAFYHSVAHRKNIRRRRKILNQESGFRRPGLACLFTGVFTVCLATVSG